MTPPRWTRELAGSHLYNCLGTLRLRVPAYPRVSPQDQGRGSSHAGGLRCLLRAPGPSATSLASGGLCKLNAGVGMQYLDWIHEDHLRPSGDLADDDGQVDPGKVVALPQLDD